MGKFFGLCNNFAWTYTDHLLQNVLFLIAGREKEFGGGRAVGTETVGGPGQEIETEETERGLGLVKGKDLDPDLERGGTEKDLGLEGVTGEDLDLERGRAPETETGRGQREVRLYLLVEAKRRKRSKMKLKYLIPPLLIR